MSQCITEFSADDHDGFFQSGPAQFSGSQRIVLFQRKTGPVIGFINKKFSMCRNGGGETAEISTSAGETGAVIMRRGNDVDIR